MAKTFDCAKKSAVYALQATSEKVTQKTSEVTGDLIVNKYFDVVSKLCDNKITCT